MAFDRNAAEDQNTALGIRLTVGRIGKDRTQALHFAVRLGLQLVHKGAPALIGIDRQAVILADGHMECGAQLFAQLGRDKETALGVDIVCILTGHSCHLLLSR